MALTGRFWFRKTWTGKLVLQVEEKRSRWFRGPDAFKLFWRDAKLLDLAEYPLRGLILIEQPPRPAGYPVRVASAPITTSSAANSDAGAASRKAA